MIKRGLPLGESALIPLDDLQAFVKRQLKSALGDVSRGDPSEELMLAVIDGYFSDAWQTLLSAWNVTYRLPDGELHGIVAVVEHQLVKLIEHSCGTLVPSYIYRYQVEGSTLRLSSFLPDSTAGMPDDVLPYSWCYS